MGKGDNFEREVCRLLSIWWTDGTNDDVCWRNRTRRTSKTPKAEKQLGDLIPTHPTFIPFTGVFNVELKTGYKKTKGGSRYKQVPWDLLDLIDSKDEGKVFKAFWAQTVLDARISQRFPLLIFKRDYHTPVVAIWTSHFNKLRSIIGEPKKMDMIRIYPKNNDIDTIHLFAFHKFFNWLHPDAVKMIYTTDFNDRRLKVVKRNRLIKRRTNVKP